MVSKFLPATKQRRCPVCDGDHKCSTTADGLVLCGRRDGPVEGFDHLGPAKDPTWHLFRVTNDRSGEPCGVSRRVAPPETRRLTPHGSPDPTPAGLPLQEFAHRCGRALTDAHRAALAQKLGLPVEALLLAPALGWDAGRGCYTVPEYDADGRLVGVATRYPDGTKRMAEGSRRGLVLPAGWLDAAGPLFVVEGFSDAIALAHCGLCVVGRPSNRGGVEHLAPLIDRLEKGRAVVVFGENDRKPDGSWPGWDGAEAVAAELRKRLPGRTVGWAMPPDGYKDAREWVRDRASGWSPAGPGGTPAHWHELGRDIAAATDRKVRQAKADPAARAAPPNRVLALVAADRLKPDGSPAVEWVWDGFLARGSVTLLSALPKCGKTTLLTHLLATLADGGAFCGRAVAPGKAVVLTEESPEVWHERAGRLGLTGRVRLAVRPFFGRPSEEEWLRALTDLLGQLAADDADLIVLDTLADLWPVRDENNATDVQAAMKPLRKLADGRAVLCVHHLRKSDGAEGTGSRGSGALAGFADVLVELRRAKAATDPTGRSRVLTAMGRFPGIPAEWLVRLAEDGAAFEHVPADEAARQTAVAKVEGREAREDGRIDLLREALCSVIPFADETMGLSRKEIWDRLPAAAKVNEVRFRSVLEAECGTLWVKEGGVGRNGFRYRRVRNWMARE